MTTSRMPRRIPKAARPNRSAPSAPPKMKRPTATRRSLLVSPIWSLVRDQTTGPLGNLDQMRPRIPTGSPAQDSPRLRLRATRSSALSQASSGTRATSHPPTRKPMPIETDFSMANPAHEEEHRDFDAQEPEQHDPESANSDIEQPTGSALGEAVAASLANITPGSQEPPPEASSPDNPSQRDVDVPAGSQSGQADSDQESAT